MTAIAPGDRFFRLTVIRESTKSSDRMFLCRCDCGSMREVPRRSLRRGHCQSCGCLRRERISIGKIKHGHSMRCSMSAEYQIWRAMKARCNNRNNTHYESYGGRGIKLCKRWESFERFFSDMGPRPTAKHTIDRRNNDRGYCPSNCRWATKKVQVNNTRRTVYLPFRGKRTPLTEVAETLGMPRERLYRRLFKLGWTAKKACSTPRMSNQYG